MNIFRVKSTNKNVVTYDGSVKDTAALIGLYYQRMIIDQILFIGEPTIETSLMIADMNRFLRLKNWPTISSVNNQVGSVEILDHDPLRMLGWPEKDYVHVLKLAGISLPQK